MATQLTIGQQLELGFIFANEAAQLDPIAEMFPEADDPDLYWPIEPYEDAAYWAEVARQLIESTP